MVTATGEGRRERGRRSLWLRASLAVAAAIGGGAALAGIVPEAAGAAATGATTVYVGNYYTRTAGVLGFDGSASGNAAPVTNLTSTSFTTADLYDMAFDGAGDLWTGNWATGTVTELTAAQVAAGGPQTPTVTIHLAADSVAGLAFDGAGNLWVSDYGNDTLTEYPAATLLPGASPTPKITITSADTSLHGPENIAFDANGDLWVANSGTTNTPPSTVVEFTPAQLEASGAPTPVVTLSSTGHTSLDYAAGLAFDASGDLWVTSYDSKRVVEYTPTQLTTGAPVPARTLKVSGPWGLGFDSKGDLWVAGYDTNNIVEYAPTRLITGGSTTPSATISGSTTLLYDPIGLAISTPPTVSSITASPATPGSTATIHGTGFTSATTVDFGSVAATTVVDTSPFTLTAKVPAGTGTVTVTATTFAGTSAASSAGQFTYATPPPAAMNGYYEVASDGGIFSFTAPFHGSMGGKALNKPIVGMATTTTGKGYYEVASDGGIFAFTAPFHGSMGGKALNAPIVGMAVDPATGGYYEVASDGGIFAFTAPFHGSMGGKALNKPIVAMATS